MIITSLKERYWCISPDKSMILAVQEDFTMRVLKFQNKAVVSTFKGHSGKVIIYCFFCEVISRYFVVASQLMAQWSCLALKTTL